LSQSVPAQFLAAVNKHDPKSASLGKADRLSRVFPEEVFKRSTGTDVNPCLAIHRQNRDAYWEFLRSRFAADGKTLNSQRNRHGLFYLEAAEAYSRLLP